LQSPGWLPCREAAAAAAAPASALQPGLQEGPAGVLPQKRSGCDLLELLLQMLGWVQIPMTSVLLLLLLVLLHLLAVKLHGPASNNSNAES
jgi:hypothetical protein